MALLTDTGVTLRRLDFSETSQVMEFFTCGHGKVRAIGKGIKRSTKTRFATGLDLLEVGDMVLAVRQARQEALANLTEWKPRRALTGLREKLARLYAGQYVAEVTAALTEDWDPHPVLFHGLLDVLEELCGADAVLEPIVGYQRLLLQQIGFWPEFEVCVACRRVPAAVGDLCFSSLEGGLLCRDCESNFAEKRLVGWQALAVVRGQPVTDGGLGDGGHLPGSPTQQAFELLNYHIAHQMGCEPLLASKLVCG